MAKSGERGAEHVDIYWWKTGEGYFSNALERLWRVTKRVR